MPKVSQTYFKNIPLVSVKYPKSTPKVSKSIPKVSQRYPKIIPKVPKKYTKSIPKVTKKLFEIPNWGQHAQLGTSSRDAQIGPFLSCFLYFTGRCPGPGHHYMHHSHSFHSGTSQKPTSHGKCTNASFELFHLQIKSLVLLVFIFKTFISQNRDSLHPHLKLCLRSICNVETRVKYLER